MWSSLLTALQHFSLSGTSWILSHSNLNTARLIKPSNPVSHSLFSDRSVMLANLFVLEAGECHLLLLRIQCHQESFVRDLKLHVDRAVGGRTGRDERWYDTGA